MRRKITFIILACYLITAGLAAQVQSGQIVERLFGRDGEIYFKFGLDNKDRLAELSRIVSIDKLDENGEVFAYANKKEFGSFLTLDIPYEKLPHPGDFQGELKMLDDIYSREVRDWDYYPTYDAYVDMMYQFETDYPGICHVFSIGTTVQGRELLMAKISDNVSFEENEPRFLYTSSIHGDELTGYVLMLRLIDYLLSNYGQDARVTSLVNNIEIWINPLANPDGTYAGGNDTVYGARRYNAYYVDLNRNYPDPDEGPHPDGNVWQPETIAFMDMAEGHHFVSSCNFHGGAEVCNYPWDTWKRGTADSLWWEYVCREYADTVHFHAPAGYLTDLDTGITNGWAWYTISGGRQDYMNYFQQCREFTLEISETKMPSPGQLPSFWEYNYRSLLNYMEQSTFGIRGTVKDSVSGWPLEAEMYILDHEFDSSWVYSTLPNGNYHRLIYEGTYDLRVTHPNYPVKVIQNVQVTNRVATVLNIKLYDTLGGIEGLIGEKHIIRLLSNPVRDGIIRVSSDVILQRVMLFSGNGQLVKDLLVYDKEAAISASGLPQGIYYLKARTEKGMSCTKVMLIK